jgi:hypothetical protein
MNVEWDPEGVVLRNPKVLEATRMTTNYFLKHEVPFQYDFETGMLERVNLMKLKCANQIASESLGVERKLE